MSINLKYKIYKHIINIFKATFYNYEQMDHYGRAGFDISEYLRLKRLPRYKPTETTLFGYSLKLVDSKTFLSGFREIFIDEIYRFKATDEHPLIIDCGANIGLSIAYFKKIAPDSKIIAFEADPNIFEILKYNVKSIGCDNVELYDQAVWTKDGEIEFMIEGAYSGRIPKMGDSCTIKVKSKRLKDILNIPVEFLKIDIEGAEYDVIEDCKEVLHLVKNIFIEYHSHESEDQMLHRLLDLLKINKFRYHIHEAYTSPQPFIKRNLLLGMDSQLNIFGYR